jgi:SpoVK/Ycf46/Vps4 family AAA+-type ATPase
MEPTRYEGSKIWREINNLREQQSANCVLVNVAGQGSFPYLEEGIFCFKWSNAEEILCKCLELAGYDLIIIFSLSGNIQFPSLEMEREFKSFFNASTSPVNPQDEYSILGAEVQGNRLFQIPNNTVECGRVISRFLTKTKLKVALIVSRIDILLPKSGVDLTLVDIIKKWLDDVPNTLHFILFLTDNLEDIHPSFQLVLDRQIKVITWGMPDKEGLETLYLYLSTIYPRTFEGSSIEALAKESLGLSYHEIKGILTKYLGKGTGMNIEEIRKSMADIDSLKAKNSGMIIKEKPTIKFTDVGGLEDAKSFITQRIIQPLKKSELAQAYGLSGKLGALFYGPPGNGKTYIVKAMAGELDSFFFPVSVSDLIIKWVGDTEQKIQQLFATASSFKRSIICIDEIESLLPNRDTTDSNFMLRVSSQFLAELDGIRTKIPEGGDQFMLVIGMTNKPWLIDSAFLRPGRLGRHIFVGLPDLKTREAILKIHLRNRLLAPVFDFERLSSLLKGYSGADIEGICDMAAENVFNTSFHQDTRVPISTEHVLRAIQVKKTSVTPETVQEIIQWAKEKGWLNPEELQSLS